MTNFYARMFLNRLPDAHPFCENKRLQNEFYIGNLLPDTVRDKSTFYDGSGCITAARYMSEDYYYGDYTKMNTWLWDKFHLPEDLKPGKDPGIPEADYSAVQRILEKIVEEAVQLAEDEWSE